MTPSGIETMATVLFGLAVIHTFSIKRFQHFATFYQEGSIGENFFHLLGEVEVVFGFWAGVLLLFITATEGGHHAIEYLEGRNYTEPAFVFVIMTIAATKPIIRFATAAINIVASLIPIQKEKAFYLSALVIGPLLGSFITEPAAMTVTALILKNKFFDRGAEPKFMYLTLGVLFVNVSIGGVLTPFAAPPVLMVASTFGWGFTHMFTEFGWKAILAVSTNAILVTAYGGKAFQKLQPQSSDGENQGKTPWWLMAIHLGFLALVVITSHHPIVFLGCFLFFLGVTAVTEEHQETIKIKESLLVAFFLAGLVTLGGLQSWWLQPLLESLGEAPLYLGAAALTAITDNAALTYLGSQVHGLSEAMKYSLVAGSVVGGGLTVIANAPNPAGYSILRTSFGKEGISPLGLLAGALIPTIIAVSYFWFLPQSL